MEAVSATMMCAFAWLHLNFEHDSHVAYHAAALCKDKQLRGCSVDQVVTIGPDFGKIT